jgi:hypothetical protein
MNIFDRVLLKGFITNFTEDKPYVDLIQYKKLTIIYCIFPLRDTPNPEAPEIELVPAKFYGYLNKILIERPERFLSENGQVTYFGLTVRTLLNETIPVVLETNSSIIIDSIRLAIKNGELSNKDVVVNIFRIVEGLVKKFEIAVETVYFDKKGNNNWPTGFCDQRDEMLNKLAGWA